MRYNLIFFLLLLCTSVTAQQVRVNGTLTTSNGQQFVYPRAILNDTLERYAKKYLTAPGPGEEEKFLKTYEDYQALSKDSTLIAKPDGQGKFSMMADLRDSVIFRSYAYYTQRHAVKDLLKKDSIHIILEKIPCTPFQKCNTPAQKLYVFIGEKILVNRAEKKIYCNTFLMDGEYDAQYRIVKNIYGDYQGDTVKFAAYDHYGNPSFSNHRYVMLFVAEYCGKLIHQKYQYFDVYPTANGRWASPGDPLRFDRPEDSQVRGELIPFGDLNFDKIIDERYKNMKFSEPYFKIDENCVIPVRGAYVEELFEIKKERALKESGFTFPTTK